MRVVTYTEAEHQSLTDLVDEVVEDSDYTIITRPEAPHAVMMSLDLFNSLMKTTHLLLSPANASHLETSLAELRAGTIIQRALIESDD